MTNHSLKVFMCNTVSFEVNISSTTWRMRIFFYCHLDFHQCSLLLHLSSCSRVAYVLFALEFWMCFILVLSLHLLTGSTLHLFTGFIWTAEKLKAERPDELCYKVWYFSLLRQTQVPKAELYPYHFLHTPRSTASSWSM